MANPKRSAFLSHSLSVSFSLSLCLFLTLFLSLSLGAGCIIGASPCRVQGCKHMIRCRYTLSQRKSNFPRYNLKCSGENVILRGIFHGVSCLTLHVMSYRRNLDYFSDSAEKGGRLPVCKSIR